MPETMPTAKQTREVKTMNDVKSNKKLVEDFCAAVFVNHDLIQLDRYMKDGYIQHNPDVPQGKAGFREFFEATFRAMPDFRYVLKGIVAQGDMVWMYSRTTGTHTGVNGLACHQRATSSLLT